MDLSYACAYVLLLFSTDPDLWKKWVAKLEEKNFFNNAPAGSEEHTARTKKALAKFKEKFGDVKKPAAAVRLLLPLCVRSEYDTI